MKLQQGASFRDKILRDEQDPGEIETLDRLVSDNLRFQVNEALGLGVFWDIDHAFMPEEER